jgi:hypothetical protein
MGVKVSCPKCKVQYNTPDSAQPISIKCSTCGSVFRTPVYVGKTINVVCHACKKTCAIPNPPNSGNYRCPHCGNSFQVFLIGINETTTQVPAAVGLIGGAALGGALGGAVFGAELGGPVGAIVGGIVGALIGKNTKAGG